MKTSKHGFDAPAPPSVASLDFEAICNQQPRALRVFNHRLEVIYDNTPERDVRYPIYKNKQGEVVSFPPEGPLRRGWVVHQVFANGQPRRQKFYLDEEAANGQGQCYCVRAWPYRDHNNPELYVVEEIEKIDKHFCPEEQLKQLDKDLSKLLNEAVEVMQQHSAPELLRIRLNNPSVQICHNIKDCEMQDYPARQELDGQRCWQVNGTECSEEMHEMNVLEKFIHCNECEVFQLAMPDPLTRVGENFNRLLSLLQLKYQEALDAQQEVQQADKLATIGELMLGLAHEVKTPLSVISGRLECLSLEMGTISEVELAEDLRVMKAHAERMAKLLEDLLKLSRPEPSQPQTLQMNQIIANMIQMTHKTMEKDKIELSVDPAPSLPEVLADPLQVQQVLLNVLLNARNAMEGEPGSIRIVTRPVSESSQGTGVDVLISDTGKGMEPGQLARIFSPFYSTKTRTGGTGLGLSVCQRIMTHHGGKIEAISESGKGSTFRLWFPPGQKDSLS